MILRAIREAVVLTLLAALFGVAYTALTGRGFFGPSRALLPPTEGLQMITLAEAKAAFESGDGLFIDTRHPYEFNLGHIPHALNFPLADLDARRSDIERLPRGRRLFIYCDGAECNSSIETGARFLQLGFRDVHVLFGGWQEWKARNLPTEGDAR